MTHQLLSADGTGHDGTAADDRVQPFPYWIVTFDGTRLRKHRRERELSQERLSYRSRVSLGTIQRIEKLPAASCHVGTLQRLASALSSNPDALIAELTVGLKDSPQTASPPRPQKRPRPDPWWQRAKPFPADRAEHGRYDAALARELLAMTGEFPHTKGSMIILLKEYRQALYDIAVRGSEKGDGE